MDKQGFTIATASAILFLILIGPPATPTAQAQIPDEFTNLKVLPKDISKRELVGMMRNFAGSLGVRCKHCHVGESTDSLEGFDFASDEKEAKQVARTMMKMTKEINDLWLPATQRKERLEVRCVTCHHGMSRPQTLAGTLRTILESEGLEAGIARYRKLREESYGLGRFNFGPGTLNQLAEEQAQKHGDIGKAIALMNLNLEFNPEASYSHFLLGNLHRAAGDFDKARKSIEKAISLEPENKWYKRQLAALDSAKTKE